METVNPLVSVIVPTKNSQKFLEKCLASIQSQSYAAVELIVVDNFSTDKTEEIARHFTTLVFQHGPERSAQVNFGASHARGKYLYRVDSDFTVDKEHIKNMVEKCEREALDGILTFNRSDTSVGFWAEVRNLERNTYRDDELILAARFFTKHAFDVVGGFDETLVAAEDYDLQNRLYAARFKFGTVDTADTHLGEPQTLGQIARENFYYGKTIAAYAKKHPKKGLKQLAPIRPSYVKHWREFIFHPVLAIGLVIYKSVAYIAAGLGFLFSK